jgi:hypothetical protein
MNPLLRVAIPLAQLVRKAPFVAFLSAKDLAAEIEAAGLRVIEQARHGTTRKDTRIFLVAQKPA